MLPRPGGWLSRCCAYQGSFRKSSKSVVNSVVHIRESAYFSRLCRDNQGCYDNISIKNRDNSALQLAIYALLLPSLKMRSLVATLIYHFCRKNALTNKVSAFSRGWGRWIRTIVMQESKSCALPLGDTPIESFQCIIQQFKGKIKINFRRFACITEFESIDIFSFL